MTPYHINSATWSSPITSRLLAEAGWGDFATSLVEKIAGHPARSIEAFAREVLAPALG